MFLAYLFDEEIDYTEVRLHLTLFYPICLSYLSLCYNDLKSHLNSPESRALYSKM